MTFSEISHVFAFALVLLVVFVLFDGTKIVVGSILLISYVALIYIPLYSSKEINNGLPVFFKGEVELVLVLISDGYRLCC